MVASLAEFGSLPIARPPSLRKSFGLRSIVLPSADHDQPSGLEPRRHDQFQCRVFLAGKTLRLGRPRHQVSRRSEGLARGGAEFQPVVAEHHENALGGGSERAKAELEGVGHR